MKANSLFLRSTLVAFSITVVMTAPLAAQWVACATGSTTCTNSIVGVGYIAPTYPVHVNYTTAVSAGPVSTGGEGNFNTAFAAE